MHRFRSVFMSLLMALAINATLGASVASAASCGGSKSACDHTSPQTTGCYADAVTKKTVHTTDAGGRDVKVELRYSPSCRTAWSRVTMTGEDGATCEGIDETVIRQSDGVSDTDHDCVVSGLAGYSHQLYVRGVAARACGKDDISGQVCTAYVTFPA